MSPVAAPSFLDDVAASEHVQPLALHNIRPLCVKSLVLCWPHRLLLLLLSLLSLASSLSSSAADTYQAPTHQRFMITVAPLSTYRSCRCYQCCCGFCRCFCCRRSAAVIVVVAAVL